MAYSPTSISKQIKVFSSSDGFSFKIDKPGQTYRLLRGVLLAVIVITFVGNLIFILDAATNILSTDDTDYSAGPKHRGGVRPILPGIVEIDDEEHLINIEVLSSKDNVSMTSNGIQVYVNERNIKVTGILVVVLNQATGAAMASGVFDTYSSTKDSGRLVQFLDEVTIGRIICFAISDEASHSLKKKARNTIKTLGSMYVNRIQWRDMWAFVVQKRKYGGRVLAEGYQKCPNPYDWPSPVIISTSFLPAKDSTIDDCHWEDTEQNRRRKEFCSKYDVYPIVCRCTNPITVDFDNPPFLDGTRFNLPVAVMAGNRPRYLFRMLLSLKQVIGLNASMVTIYIDGYFPEVTEIGKLFNLKVMQHKPVSKNNARISQHYKKSLSTSFDENPDADYLVILEEDLDISIDILSFFKQLLPVLEKDKSLFCISAWNDQGYKHSINDASLTYRIELMPGLGWVLPRKIYKNELEPDWPTPDKMWDWDIWVRTMKLTGRECIIPDISRTFHFGAKGINMNPFFQELYFDNHAFNKEPNVKINADLMYKDNYEAEIDRLISHATVLNHTTTPCSHPKTFIPDTKSKTYVFYIDMINGQPKHWINTARCFKIWDMDVRGAHKFMFRFWIRGNHLMVIGCPESPYCKYKPSDVIPVKVKSVDKKEKA